jgi:hypothetical protein
MIFSLPLGYWPQNSASAHIQCMVENLLSLVGGGDGFVPAHEGFPPILSRYLFIACIALV